MRGETPATVAWSANPNKQDCEKRMTGTSTEILATFIFALALVHTFSTKFFAKLAHTDTKHSGFWHLLAEVEVVFGFWAFVLLAAMALMSSHKDAVTYLEARNFTEPMFVFVVMVIAASKPILVMVGNLVMSVARMLPLSKPVGTYFLCLFLVPLLGSFITEPAAMTLAALILRDAYFKGDLSNRLRYATLGVLFVNISIGGTLTNFAAPPVLMVAAKWEWDTTFMLVNFGWKSAVAVFINAVAVTWLFRTELNTLKIDESQQVSGGVPLTVTGVHLLFLVGVIFFAHHPVVFVGLLLFFIGYTEAYKAHQDRLILREALLVAFFLAGLVILGGLQAWWLQPALVGVEPSVLFFIATGLTAITDNAALTYLASLVEGTSPEFRYAITAGAVTGGGLTVIANAPNPAGLAILKDGFHDQAVSPLKLLFAAALPTAVAAVALLGL